MQNWYKTYLLIQPYYLNFLIFRFDLFRQTVVPWDSNQSSLPPKFVSVLYELPNKPTVYENP